MKIKHTFLNRRLDLKASRIEAFVLPKVDFPLSLRCCTVLELDTPTNFNCSRICEIILRTFVGVAERNKNRSKYGMCSASIVLMHDNDMVITFTKQKIGKACYYHTVLNGSLWLYLVAKKILGKEDERKKKIWIWRLCFIFWQNREVCILTECKTQSNLAK